VAEEHRGMRRKGCRSVCVEEGAAAAAAAVMDSGCGEAAWTSQRCASEDGGRRTESTGFSHTEVFLTKTTSQTSSNSGNTKILF
jgi:hypothetical protein